MAKSAPKSQAKLPSPFPAPVLGQGLVPEGFKIVYYPFFVPDIPSRGPSATLVTTPATSAAIIGLPAKAPNRIKLQLSRNQRIVLRRLIGFEDAKHGAAVVPANLLKASCRDKLLTAQEKRPRRDQPLWRATIQSLIDIDLVKKVYKDKELCYQLIYGLTWVRISSQLSQGLIISKALRARVSQAKTLQLIDTLKPTESAESATKKYKAEIANA